MSKAQNETSLDIGLTDEARKAIAGILSQALADTFAVYLKTHNYHWNVKGPNFPQLHVLFDGQYTELHASIDSIAERIRAVGYPATGSFSALASLTTVKEPMVEPSAEDMVRDLIESNQALVRSLRQAEAALTEFGDVNSADLMVARIGASEKHAWMLRMIVS